MEVSIDSLVKQFDKEWGIPKSKKLEYGAFIEYNLSQVSEKEIIDLTLLFSYVNGDRGIIDRDDGKEKEIRQGKLEDLALLSISNIYAKNSRGERYNPELYKLIVRFGDRNYKNKNKLGYKAAFNIVFKDPRITAYLGAEANYDSHVKYFFTEEEDLLELMKYALGEKTVTDSKTKEKITIKTEKDFFALLSIPNVYAKDSKDNLYNPEIRRLAVRFYGRHKRDRDSLTYRVALKNVFGSRKVSEYLNKNN